MKSDTILAAEKIYKSIDKLRISIENKKCGGILNPRDVALALKEHCRDTNCGDCEFLNEVGRCKLSEDTPINWEV